MTTHDETGGAGQSPAAEEPTEAEVQRVSFVLMQFVKPWGLPLNPENLDLMAYCALRYGLNSSQGWTALQSSIAAEIERDRQQHARMLEAMRRSIEERG